MVKIRKIGLQQVVSQNATDNSQADAGPAVVHGIADVHLSNGEGGHNSNCNPKQACQELIIGLPYNLQNRL